MSHTSRHTMWPHQHYFELAAGLRARDLFRRLDNRFDPRILLVGFLMEPLEGHQPICLQPEPEDSGYSAQCFAEVEMAAKQFLGEEPPRRPRHGGAAPSENLPDKRLIRARMAAVLLALEQDDASLGWASYCSTPAVLDGYEIFLVLQLQDAIKRDHPELAHAREDGDIPKPRLTDRADRSLIDSAAREFLQECRNVLLAPSAGADLLFAARETGEILRNAAKAFVNAHASSLRSRTAIHILFDALSTISTLRYEGQEGIGRLVLCGASHPLRAAHVRLVTPISIANGRATRKLLQVCSDRLALLSDGEQVFGLCSLEGPADPRAQDCFIVEFLRHGEWRLLHDGRPLLHLSYGTPTLPTHPIGAARFAGEVQRIFPQLTAEALDHLWRVVDEASRQKHGTTLIISAKAQQEAQRLSAQATPIEPLALTAELTSKITAIDGAVLVDPDCRCHAIGVILDGLATPAGDPARGARFNSAIRYVESNKGDALAIVVSEDGTIDLVPTLRPRLRRSEIEAHIQSLEHMITLPSVRLRHYTGAIQWLEDHRFYMTAGMCSRINHAVDELSARFERDGQTRVVRGRFALHPGADESYLVD